MIKFFQYDIFYPIYFSGGYMINSGRSFVLIFLILLTVFLPGAISDNAPERIILSLTAEPATSMAVTWRTNLWCENPRVEYMKATAEVNRKGNKVKSSEYKKVRTISAESEKVNTKNDIYVYSHSAVLKGLKPETLYQYRVGYGKTWSEWEHFETSVEVEEAFRFIYLGDPQNNLKSFCSRIFRTAYSSAPDASFILVAGDLVSRPWVDFSWGELFYAAGWITRRLPFVMVAGNHSYYHEDEKDDVENKQHWLWRPHFTQPENGPEGLAETSFTYVYQGVRFVVLNGNEQRSEQAVWLENILKNSFEKWKIIAIHHPVYSTGLDRDDPELRKLFLPIIDKYNVDLVLQGHDHAYGRTYKLKRGRKVSASEKGTYFVVSVSGPKVYELNMKHKDLMAKMCTGIQLYQIISIEKNLISYKSYKVTGELFDSFKIEK